MDTKIYTLELGGKTITATFSNLVDQAGGAVMMACEGTVVLATACISKDGKNNPGFFNLTVEYLEKNYAAGMILGGQYNKREGRPSDEAILSSRIIDRTIRPFFENHIKNAVQVVVTVISLGGMDPAVLGINAASLALSVSPIPWNGPIGAVLIGKLKGKEEIEINPYAPSTGESPYDLDITVCGTNGKICMIEALSFEFTEEQMKSVFAQAMTQITILENWQKEMNNHHLKQNFFFTNPTLAPEYVALWNESFNTPVSQNIFGPDGKKNMYAYEDEWMKVIEAKVEGFADAALILSTARDFYHHQIDTFLHVGALTADKRADGRALTQVRKLTALVGGISERLHGTGIFLRGETHVMSILTLGGPETSQAIEGMEVRGVKRFSHHYNFPAYSVGETGRFGGINRREMGHGFLAEKALTPVIPTKDIFPYTIRVVSECLASNGSTSQAAICAATLALMDGGVPITKPVAGISVGLMLDETDETKYKLLTDIQGPEDHHGDMDFKVAGTRDGITAIQLDIKVGGIPVPILCDALDKARDARLGIIDTLTATIATPRPHISTYAPHIIHIKIQPDQIGLVIGGGGKTIKGIKEKTGAEITIEDSGDVFIAGTHTGAGEAKEMIEGMTREWKVNDMATGTVVKILEIGAIVSISPFADGLVHISEIAPFRVMKVTDVLHEGMTVPVVVTAVDKERDKISLSIKHADKDFIKMPASYAVAKPTPTPSAHPEQ